MKIQVYIRRIMLLLLILGLGCAGEKSGYSSLMEEGEFARAEEEIRCLLADESGLSAEQRRELAFEIERMERIRKDFTRSEEDVLAFIRQYIPDVGAAQLARWEAEKSLECMVIDGRKLYFNNAARNLFRIDRDCKKIWDNSHAKEGAVVKSEEAFDLDEHNAGIINSVLQTGSRYASPLRMRIYYTITVRSDAVPDGETVRCWIPYPREVAERQTDVRLLATDPPLYTLADNSQLQRTIYFEKPAVSGRSTEFSVEYEYTSYGSYVAIDAESVTRVDSDDALAMYLQERPPHIVFTKELKKLSRQIVGDESNPYRIAQKLFAWVDAHIPWASAREYSTIENLSAYCIENMHGDCGIMSLLFITLCRMNGIPARWQSGWDFEPPDDTMHDWGMIYFAPYGWMSMDVYYGLRESDDERVKWFYLSGMDSYRLIFNDDYSQPLHPEKEHFRSETVDSQRGEVEWRGGNLYFDQWDWQMRWKVVE